MLKISTNKKTKEKILFKNKWVSLKEINGYSFLHEERSKGKIVAVLGYKIKEKQLEILGRFEITIAHNNSMELCSLTGGIEENESALDSAVRELFEESGIKENKENFVSLGTIKNYKAADTTTYLYCVNLQGKDPAEKAKGDGTGGEKDTYCKWISADEIIDCKDPLTHSMLLRLMKKMKDLKVV